ncbi:MAG: CoA transferase [Thermodesulfobacteriota bacterium]|jgi:crotonobetainyl-CoA:carnitine CoA-transferase CaiB-like acyl-CoA transferase
MSGPLSGVRVLDFSSAVTGPFCTMLMGDLGADVIKIESAGGDILRHLNVTFKAGVGSWFINFNRNKRSIQLDLKHPDARQTVLRMAAQSDVLVQNFRPGVMERLGLDYAAVRAHNPKIVYLSISGFGAEGPYAHKPCYDPVIQGMSGVAFVQGGKGKPTFVRMAMADKMTSMNAIYHVLAGLVAAERQGIGQEIKLSMLDSLISFIAPDCMFGYTFIPDDEFRHLSIADAVMQPIPTKDGYVIACAATNEQWERMCRAMGKPEWVTQYPTPGDRAAHIADILAALDALFPQKTTKEWLAIFEAADVPCGPVYTFDEVLQDPQLAINQTFVEYDHPVAGRVRGVNVPGKFSATPTRVRHHAPGLGEHTVEILREFGLTPGQIAALLEANVATQAPSPCENGLARAATA